MSCSQVENRTPVKHADRACGSTRRRTGGRERHSEGAPVIKGRRVAPVMGNPAPSSFRYGWQGRGHHRPGKAPLPRLIVRFLIWDATIFCHFAVRSEEKRSPYPPSRMGADCRAERDGRSPVSQGQNRTLAVAKRLTPIIASLANLRVKVAADDNDIDRRGCRQAHCHRMRLCRQSRTARARFVALASGILSHRLHAGQPLDGSHAITGTIARTGYP